MFLEIRNKVFIDPKNLSAFYLIDILKGDIPLYQNQCGIEDNEIQNENLYQIVFIVSKDIKFFSKTLTGSEAKKLLYDISLVTNHGFDCSSVLYSKGTA
jgi:hypothetical protein